jgi:glycosyltransferase involved in cell wall biosynthesis
MTAPSLLSRRPIGYVMEQTLGNVTHYLNLRQAESTAEAPGPLWLPIQYHQSWLPWTIAGGRIARKAVAEAMPQLDGIFMHSSALALMCADLFRKKPAVLSTDGTPANKRDMRAAYGLRRQGRLRERVNRAISGSVYGTAAGLVGWSNWVKQSFVDDYGYPEENVAVIPPGVDVDQFVAGDRNHELPRILFVGGEFRRKGGALLVDVFRQRLRGRAELILVTRDEVRAEPGVTVHNNVRTNSPELHALFATSDLFVLPTLADCFSMVLIEALASGIPVIATRVGGIPEIVLEGKTGHLVDAGDSAALGDALEALICDPNRRRSMGEQGRADALLRYDARENARRLFAFVRSLC